MAFLFARSLLPWGHHLVVCPRILLHWIHATHLHLHYFLSSFLFGELDFHLHSSILLVYTFISCNWHNLLSIMLTITWRFLVFVLILHCLIITWFNFPMFYSLLFLSLKSLANSLQFVLVCHNFTFIFRLRWFWIF